MFRFLASLTFSCLCAFAAGQGQEHGGYFMETQTHDIVMVVGRWTCSSDLALGALVKHLKVPIGLIYVIGPPPVAEACSAVQATYTNLLCVPEEYILPMSVITTTNAKNFTILPIRKGWYYQQMLKLLAVYALPLRAHYLIWDADNVLIRDYSPYLNGAMRLIASNIPAAKSNTQYVITTEELVHIVPEPRNVVVHQICVVRSVMTNMLRYICGDSSGEKCASIIYNRIPEMAHPRTGLSEYQLYTTYQSHAYYDAYVRTNETFLRDDKRYWSTAAPSCEKKLAALKNIAMVSAIVKFSVVLEVNIEGMQVGNNSSRVESIPRVDEAADKDAKAGADISEDARSCIGEWIMKYNFKKFGEICGDENWSRQIPNIDRVNYTGFVASTAALSPARGNNPSFIIQELDLSRTPPPYGYDVFMALNVQKFPSYSALNLYRNLLLAGVRYLLTSRYSGIQHVNDVYNPSFDMLKLPPPLETFRSNDNSEHERMLTLIKLPFFFEPKIDTAVCSKVHTFVEKSVKKSICLDKIVPGSCVVYSFGINYQWEFDDFMHSYGCTVHSFDPGMTYKDKRAENHFFHKVGLGNHTGEHTGPSTLYNQGIKYSVATVQSLMKKLGHNYVDLIRLDVEGAEWDVLDFLPYHQFGQLSLEVHMWKESYEFYLLKMENIPMKSWATYQNVDRVNKMTMTEVIPGVTRVYELAFLW